jgi:hypothetical protein
VLIDFTIGLTKQSEGVNERWLPYQQAEQSR